MKPKGQFITVISENVLNMALEKFWRDSLLE
jgi:hypothetical protein